MVTYVDGSAAAFNSVSDKNSFGWFDTTYLLPDPYPLAIKELSLDWFLDFAWDTSNIS